MELREAVALARERLDDDAVQADGNEGANLWSTTELIGYFREAQREAAQRARLLFDDQTASIVNITIVEDQAEYTLHHSIFDVRRVAYNDNYSSLGFTTIENLDCGTITDDYGLRRIGRWRNRTESRGRQYILTRTPREAIKLRVYPIPKQTTYTDSAGTDQPLMLNLSVYRRPVWPLRSLSDRFEIHPDYHERLLDWVLFRAYSKRDADTYRPDKAQNHEGAFIGSFGILEDADVRRQQFEARPTQNRGWGMM